MLHHLREQAEGARRGFLLQCMSLLLAHHFIRRSAASYLLLEPYRINPNKA
jgi:hypothetical protein